jgi:hypothetical protein
MVNGVNKEGVMKVNAERLTVKTDRSVVVFLIGMRVNSWWRFWEWIPIAAAMSRMLRELGAAPAKGLLHHVAYFGSPTLMVQYWESTEALLAYAHDRTGQHHPAWAAFNKRVAKVGSVGIWHETYQVPAGSFECIYHQMPTFGLGKALGTVPATGRRAQAKERLAAAA